MMSGQVPNPLHQALSGLLAELQRDEDLIGGALKGACQRMASGSVLAGHNASVWQTELEGRSGDLAAKVRALIAEVAQKLNSLPQTISPEDAANELKSLAGSIGL